MKGNLKILGLGGMGINVVHSVISKVPTGEDFADYDITLMDTTEATISNYPSLQNNFIKINPTKNKNKELDGLSGERKNKLVVEDIRHNVEEHVDKLTINKNDYYVLLFSSSGGSGNIIGSILTKELLKKNANVLVITTIDSSNYLVTHNSIKTLESLDMLSRSLNKPLLLSIFSNNARDSISTPDSERRVNTDILKLLAILSMYVSGSTHDLDHQDMSNFFNPSNYKTFRIEPGLYHLDIAMNDITRRDDVLLSRTLLAINREDIKLPRNILHNKTGYATKEHIEKFGENNFPMYLLYVKNKPAEIHSLLKEDLNRLEVTNRTTSLVSDENDDDIIF